MDKERRYDEMMNINRDKDKLKASLSSPLSFYIIQLFDRLYGKLLRNYEKPKD